MSIKSNVVEEALRLADESAQPKQAPQTSNTERAREIADALDRVMAERREVGQPLACAAAPPPLHDETVPMQAPQTPNAERAREIADVLDRVMAERREIGQPLACAAAPPPLHDETVPMREYDEDAYNIRRYEPVLRGVTVCILAAVVIIAVVMMWPITNIFRSYVERPLRAFRHLTLTAASLPPKPPRPRKVPRHPCLPTLQGQPPVITWHHFLIHL